MKGPSESSWRMARSSEATGRLICAAPSPGCFDSGRFPSRGSVLDDRRGSFRLHSGEVVEHLLKLLGRVADPFGDLADHAQRLERAVGGGHVAGEFLVGEVG